MANDARLAELRGLMAEALRAVQPYGTWAPEDAANVLLPVVEQYALRRAVADELARHTDTLSYTRDGDTVRLGCRCGHQRGTVTRRELAADLDGRMREHRLHVADAVIAVLNGPQSPPSHAGQAEGGGRMYSGGSRSELTSQDETEGRR